MPDTPRVVDASPLIVLARIGRLDLLGTAIVLPAAVVTEVLDPAGGRGRSGLGPALLLLGLQPALLLALAVASARR